MTDLEIIRAACVKANPEKDWNKLRYEQGEINGGEVDPIRLADVLLAIKDCHEKVKEITIDIYAEQLRFFAEWKDGRLTNVKWNLRADEASQQSPEFLAFAANLLK